MKGLVLAAGLGTRLRPLTDRLPKPMIPILGRPCVEPILEGLAELGLSDVAINTHWLPEPLRDHLGDGSRWGPRLHWQHEPELLDGVGTLKSFAWLFGDEPVLCVNADIVHDLDLPGLVAEHRRLGAPLTLATSPVTGPLRYPVGWDDAGRVRLIRRTGLDWPAPLQLGEFTGIMVVEPAIWRDHVPRAARCHLTIDLCPRLLAAGVPIVAVPSPAPWADIGTRSQLDAAVTLLLDRRCVRYLRGAVERLPGVWCRGAARLDGQVIAPAFLGDGSVVEAGATLGPHGSLEERARLRAGDRLARGCRLAGERS